MKKRGHSRRLLSVLLALVMLLSLLPTAVFAADPTPQTYKKVTQAPEDWSGTYLIVSEGDEAAFDSSLTKIDVSNNYKTVKIAEGTIKTTETIAVTIEKMADGNYSIKGANGKYIYQTSDANGLKTGAKATANTIALNADGTVDIVSGGAHLRFNKNSDQMRFRYFKSATYTRQQAITLYKLDAAPARQSGIVTDLTTLRDGDKVVVFNPSVKKAMSATAVATYYRAGVDVTLDSANKLTGYGDTELWTLGIKDGKYTFTTADGKKLSMGAAHASIPLDDVNTEWTITSAATEGCFYIKNVVRGNALQWYADKGNFSSKASISTTDEALFAQQLYLVIDSGSETPDPDPTFVPISEALAGENGKDFTVQGVVTLVDGQNIYLQDATGGICLRLGSKTSEIALGDTIYGTGKRAEYNKLPQLGSGTFKKSSGLTLTAKATTIGALTDKDVCGYVKLKGLEITEIYDNNGIYTSPNVTLKDADGKTIQLYKAVMEKKDGKWAFAVGDMVDVTAAVSTFNGTLQLRNTLADEIRAAGTIVDPISDVKEAFKLLKEKGAKHFGIHAFLASNTKSNDYYPMLAKIIFELAVELKNELDIHIAFINLSGGVGVPYEPDEFECDIMAIGEGVRRVYEEVLTLAGMGDVAIFTEMGRFMLAPYGALIATAIHEKHTYKEYIGLDACAANLMRPAMYGSYHHITVLGKENAPCDHKYDVTGGLCENNDKFAIDRMLPKIDMGDILYIHDTGAHGHAMGYNYNGKLRSAELLLKEDGSVEMIRRAETPADYFATLDFTGLLK